MLEAPVDVLFSQPEPELVSSTPLSEEDLDPSEVINEGDAFDKDAQAQGKRTTAPAPGHEKTIDGKQASCMITHGSQLVNCAKCLEDAQRSLLAQIPTKAQKKNAVALLAQLGTAGKMGLKAEDVWVSMDRVHMSRSWYSMLPASLTCL